MAMIKCPECGREVSDKAPNCPNCGTPIAVEKKVKVHFWRKKGMAFSAVKGFLVVDGQMVGPASNGCSLTVMLSAGSHDVSINASTRGAMADAANSSTLEIPEDAKNVDVQIVAKNSFSSIMGVSSAGLTIGDVKVER